MTVRKMIECYIPAQTRTPFPASRDFPSRGNERYEGKNSESYTSCTIPVFHPLVPYGTTFPPRWEACHLILSRLWLPANQVPLPPQAGALQGSAKPCTHKLLYFKHGVFCSRLRGKSGAAGKGEASAASQSAECFSSHMTLKVNPVTLTL